MEWTRNPKWTLTAALALVAAFGLTPGCRRTEEARAARAPAAGPGAVSQAPGDPGGPPSAEVQAAVQGVIHVGRHPWLTWPEVSGALPYLKALYAAEPDGLFWFAGEQAHPALGKALETIARCDTVGLTPADYDAGPLAAKWEALKAGPGPFPADRALFDVALTVSAMRVLQAAHWGRVDPRLVGFDYDVTTKLLDMATELRTARDGGGLAAAVAAAEPQFPVYRRLVKALADYRALAAAEPPAVPSLPAGRNKVEPGQPWASAPALAERLQPFGDLPKDAPTTGSAPDGTPLYEGALVDALKRFQGRHALEPDGIIGAGTIEALNVPAATRVRQIELALERFFSRARRDFSHGCIRLEDPARLAEWMLRHNPQWTRERIDAAMKGTRPTQVNLKSKLTVFLFYDTAYVDSKGVVHFADDYYGHDAQLDKALRHGYPYARKS